MTREGELQRFAELIEAREVSNSGSRYADSVQPENRELVLLLEKVEEWKDTRALPTLFECLRKGHCGGIAARAIGKINQKESLIPLAEVLEDWKAKPYHPECVDAIGEILKSHGLLTYEGFNEALRGEEKKKFLHHLCAIFCEMLETHFTDRHKAIRHVQEWLEEWADPVVCERLEECRGDWMRGIESRLEVNSHRHLEPGRADYSIGKHPDYENAQKWLSETRRSVKKACEKRFPPPAPEPNPVAESFRRAAGKTTGRAAGKTTEELLDESRTSFERTMNERKKLEAEETIKGLVERLAETEKSAQSDQSEESEEEPKSSSRRMKWRSV